MSGFSVKWLPEASRELIDYAESNSPTSGRVAGEIYEFISCISQTSVDNLDVVDPSEATVFRWEISDVTTYMNIENNLITVLHLAQTGTFSQREKSIRMALSRI